MGQQLPKNFRINLNGQLDEIVDLVSELHKAVELFCLLPETESQLNLILEELYTNSVNYGFTNILHPKVKIELLIDHDKLIVIYRDNGQAFNPLELRDPDLTLNIEDRAIGGLGIFFVKSLTDHAEYLYDGNFNQIRMTKYLKK